MLYLWIFSTGWSGVKQKSGWFWAIQLCPYKSIQSRFNHTLQFFASTLLHTVNHKALLTDINISNPSFPWAFSPSLQVRPASLIQMISILVYIPSLMQTSCNMYWTYIWHLPDKCNSLVLDVLDISWYGSITGNCSTKHHKNIWD